jgi:cyclopropane-fatty-acyl-phospholipid synthase
MHAAERYGAQATGCTLSQRQAEYAQVERERHGLGGTVTIHEKDYRELREQFDKVASVGMVEHVGRYRLAAYFRKIHSLMKPNGLFLNHGITRPATVPSDAQGLFVARQVFPGSRLVNLADVIGCAEEAGFEVLDVEDLRRHYALTCRAWVERLRARAADCLHAVNEKTWRIWQVYLAGSAAAFEDGTLCIYQVLLGKRGASCPMPMTREYMYPAGD